MYFCRGEMAEWSIAAVLKTVEVQASGGSNPSLSATTIKNPSLKGFLISLPSVEKFVFKSEDREIKIKPAKRVDFIGVKPPQPG